MRVTPGRKKGLRADLEPIWSLPVDADHRIGPVWNGPDIMHARLQIEPGIDRPAVQRLDLGAFEAAANLPLGLEGEEVDVTADPAFAPQ